MLIRYIVWWTLLLKKRNPFQAGLHYSIRLYQSFIWIHRCILILLSGMELQPETFLSGEIINSLMHKIILSMLLLIILNTNQNIEFRPFQFHPCLFRKNEIWNLSTDKKKCWKNKKGKKGSDIFFLIQ